MKKTRNKKYPGPKRIVPNTITAFFGGMSHQHAAHLQDTLIALHISMSKLVRGVGDEIDWNNVNQAVNMGLIMAEQGIGAEHTEALIAGRDAMVTSVLRYHERKRFGFTGGELTARNAAIDCHDAQMTCIRAVDVDRAVQELNRRLKHKVNTSSAYDPNIINLIAA